MTACWNFIARLGAFVVTVVFLAGAPAAAAPYAALVMDARTGEVLHARNADTRLHPASLTKMMTLYVVFSAIENGEISLDTVVTVSRKAALEPPSKLGLKPGQKIKLRYLIRAAAVKSANDAATALAEAVGGSEAAFARRMNRTAKALGMTRSTFKNANGLTEAGHLSTARDMTILGRHLFYDFPEYYNLFSRRSTDAGIRTVANTNRRFLAAYEGADGIKTGYTRAAGFNLVASAERGNKRIIATMFGGRSTAQRNAKVAELLDLGFRRAPSRVAVVRPVKPRLAPSQKPAANDTVRVAGAVARSIRPAPRPAALVAPPEEMLVAMAETIEQAVTAAQTETGAETGQAGTIVTAAVAAAPLPQPRPRTTPNAARQDHERIVVTRVSTSDGGRWAINVGRFTTRVEAERVLLRTALAELETLDSALRKVASSPRGHDANFVGLTEEGAQRACRRLQARNIECHLISPTG